MEVAARLARLRALCVPETIEEGRRRLADEAVAAARAEPFERAVERRLAELRALCDLAAYLHAGKRSEKA